ncbi:MAG: alpha/beta fold hydrolase [Chloroflexi bacterium]|nr:alpha/beta fold hydrolase [Chloroflexota bacterium]MBP8058589.1 alpha/beta fold hydrolase [Chloroflexota bacterium]
MIRSLYHATHIPEASRPHDSLHLKVYYPAAASGSQAERMSGIIPADLSHAPLPVLIFCNGINVGAESYHWLAVQLAAAANLVVVLYNHIAPTLPNVIGLTPAIDLARVRPDTYGSGPTCPAIQPILDALHHLHTNPSSPLYNALDLETIILGGHSAGGTIALHNGLFFPAVKAVFAYAGHTMASTMLGFPPGTVLNIADKPTLLLRGDQDGVIAASRGRYGPETEDKDPVARTFDEAYPEPHHSPAYDALITGANHFSIVYPLDETSGRSFLDQPTTRPDADIRADIVTLITTFITKHIRGQNLELTAPHTIIRHK